MSVERLAEMMTGAIAFTVVPLSVRISTFSAGILSVLFFSNEFDESDYFTFKPQVLQHIDFAAEDELASEPDYSHFIRMAN